MDGIRAKIFPVAALSCFFLSVLLETGCFASDFSKKSKEVVKIEDPINEIVVGEHLIFDVFWLGIPVGYGELFVKEKMIFSGREVYHVIARARTNEFLSKIYPVSDEFHSYLDCMTGFSAGFEKNLSEGGYRAHEKTIFDPEQKKGFYESFLNHTRKEFEIGGYVHDILSAFYWFRGQSVAVGSSVRTVVSNEEKDWDLEVRILRAETKELKGSRVLPVIVAEPRTSLRRVLYNRGRVWVYFTADRKRIPVWIMFKTPFGAVNGVLRDGV